MDKQFDFSKFKDQQEFENLQEKEQQEIVGEAQEEAGSIMETAKEIKKPFSGRINRDDLSIAEKVVEMRIENKETDRLIDEIINNKRKARTARSDAAREVYEEKVALYEKELQRIKQAHNEIEWKKKEDERKNKFDKFPSGEYETSLPGVEHLMILRGPADQKSGEIESLLAIPYNYKDYHKTFTLSEKGLSDDNEPMPKGFSFTKDEIYDEVLDIAEKMGMNSNVPVFKIKAKNSKERGYYGFFFHDF